MATTSPMPLEGMTVLDCSLIMAGPFCTLLLADMGADVIKVEPPGGDHSRSIGRHFAGGESYAFMTLNRNKRSIVLDLKSEAGKGSTFTVRVPVDYHEFG